MKDTIKSIIIICLLMVIISLTEEGMFWENLLINIFAGFFAAVGLCIFIGAFEAVKEWAKKKT